MRLASAEMVVAFLCVGALAGSAFLHFGGQTQTQTNITVKPSPTSTTFPNLITDLSTTVVKDKLLIVSMYPETPTPNYQYNCLWINGTITNTGQTKAYNAGIHIEAYAADGTLEINLTVPLADAVYGTDPATSNFIREFAGYAVAIDGTFTSENQPMGSLMLGHPGTFELGTLAADQTVNVTLAIYHEDTVATWTVTPVWANTA